MIANRIGVARSNITMSSPLKVFSNAFRIIIYFLYLPWYSILSILSILQIFIYQVRQYGLWHAPLFINYSLRHFPQVMGRLLSGKSLYQVEGKIILPATRIYISHSKITRMKIYMKLCQRNKTDDPDEEVAGKALNDLVEGFYFNRRFAPGIYIGIARIEGYDDHLPYLRYVQRGRPIFHPERRMLKPGKYAVIMRRLNPRWRLDRGLLARGSGEGRQQQENMKFLAGEIASMHKRLGRVTEQRSIYESINAKRIFNSGRLREAVKKYGNEEALQRAEQVIALMEQACIACKDKFEERQRAGHVKRCHGDLKAKNLWVMPGTRRRSAHLLATDCIDFNPDFCRIDTLSDVAMLAMDIEARTLKVTQQEQKPSEIFLQTYLELMQEDERKLRPLIEYYLTEKAMVCAYVSILFDDAPRPGERYLSVALRHAKVLEQFLRSSASEDAPVPSLA